MKPMEEKLWDAANAVTAFAVLQAVAFIYGGVQGSYRISSASAFGTQVAIGVLALVCGVIYGYTVWRCYQMALRLEIEHKETWRVTTHGRIYAIAFFQLLIILAVVFLPYAMEIKK